MRIITEQNYSFEEWLSTEQIARDVQQVADQINADYEGKEPLIIVVLNGAFIFAADLVRKLNLHCDITFLRVSSYAGMASTG
jgi:hypoxanthine-guanine phosphoribosyltransferase